MAVGTDGRRLARQVGPVKTVHGKPRSEGTTIVPTKAMHLIERALADNDDEIRLAARDNEVLVKSQRTTIYARLVEGRYPNWRGVFPRNDDAVKIEMTVGPFHAAVRQAAIVTNDDRRAVEFCFGDGKLSLSGHGAELGESHVELPIAYDGPEVSVRLDPRYVNDFLKVLEPDQTVTMELKDARNGGDLQHGGRLFLRGDAAVAKPMRRSPVAANRTPVDRQHPRGVDGSKEASAAFAAPRPSRRRGARRPANLAAEYTRVGMLRRGKLEVTVANSMLVQELTFQKPDLLKALRERLPDETIRDLRFRVGAVS